jgi:hypothetical protein
VFSYDNDLDNLEDFGILDGVIMALQKYQEQGIDITLRDGMDLVPFRASRRAAVVT